MSEILLILDPSRAVAVSNISLFSEIFDRFKTTSSNDLPSVKSRPGTASDISVPEFSASVAAASKGG